MKWMGLDSDDDAVVLEGEDAKTIELTSHELNIIPGVADSSSNCAGIEASAATLGDDRYNTKIILLFGIFFNICGSCVFSVHRECNSGLGSAEGNIRWWREMKIQMTTSCLMNLQRRRRKTTGWLKRQSNVDMAQSPARICQLLRGKRNQLYFRPPI